VHSSVRGAARGGVTAATHNSDADVAGVSARVAEQAGARAFAPAVVKDFVEDRVWGVRVCSREWSRTGVLMTQRADSRVDSPRDLVRALARKPCAVSRESPGSCKE